MGGNLQFSAVQLSSNRLVRDTAKPGKLAKSPLNDRLPGQTKTRRRNPKILQMFYYAKSAKGRGLGARDANTVSCGFWLTRPQYRKFMEFKPHESTEDMLNNLFGYKSQALLANILRLDAVDETTPQNVRVNSKYNTALIAQLGLALSTSGSNTLARLTEEKPEIAEMVLLARGHGISNADLDLAETKPSSSGLSMVFANHVPNLSPDVEAFILSLPALAVMQLHTRVIDIEELETHWHAGIVAVPSYGEHAEDTGSYGRHVAKWFWIMHAHDPGAHDGWHHKNPTVAQATNHETHHTNIHHEANHEPAHQGYHAQHTPHAKHHEHHSTYHREHSPAHHSYHSASHTHHAHHEAHNSNYHIHASHQNSSHHEAHHGDDGHFMQHLDNSQADKWWMYRSHGVKSHGGKASHGVAYQVSHFHAKHKSYPIGIEYKLGSEVVSRKAIASASQPTE